jgi:hypothetical protein
MSDVCFLVNSRPLMLKAGSDSWSGGHITPHYLPSCRVTQAVPGWKCDGQANLTSRLQFLEEIKLQFWDIKEKEGQKQTRTHREEETETRERGEETEGKRERGREKGEEREGKRERGRERGEERGGKRERGRHRGEETEGKRRRGLSCSACPVLFCLSCSVPPVLSWPYIDAQARNYERENKERKCTSAKNRGARRIKKARTQKREI